MIVSSIKARSFVARFENIPKWLCPYLKVTGTGYRHTHLHRIRRTKKKKQNTNNASIYHTDRRYLLMRLRTEDFSIVMFIGYERKKYFKLVTLTAKRLIKGSRYSKVLFDRKEKNSCKDPSEDGRKKNRRSTRTHTYYFVIYVLFMTLT